MVKTAFVLIGFVLQLAQCDVECFEGEITMGCNYCWCQDGFWNCDDEECKIDNESTEVDCIPGEVFRLECNECRCSEDGVAACRKAECIYEKNIEKYTCLLGEQKYNRCNLCGCSGEAFDVCTKMMCGESDDDYEDDDCNAGQIKKEGCKEFRCDLTNRWATSSRNC